MSVINNDDQEGQSVILVALLILTLVLFAAIAVDVTVAYYDRRTAQNAADAAALAAAQELGHKLRGESVTDADVLTKLEDFAQRNGSADVRGNYLDQDGAALAPIGEGTIPANAHGVEATALITAPTFFGGVIGLDGLDLDADAAVQFESVCYGGKCLLPIAVYAGGYTDEDDETAVNFVDGQCYNLWDGAGGGNFGWLNWSNQGNGQYSCRTYGVSDCTPVCVDHNMDPDYCSTHPDDMIQVGDYVGGAPGVMNADKVRDRLNFYISTQTVARLVVYDHVTTFGHGNAQCGVTSWNGSTSSRKGTYYHVAGFGAFQITGFRLSHGNGTAVSYDTVDPTTCLDFPNQEGLCCREWEEADDGGLVYYECANWDVCQYNTGDVNRITGIARQWTEDAFETCDAVGNFFAPRLTR
jgi:hypothetical protein